jgi:hypothetical protein
MSEADDLVAALTPVAAAFERLRVRHSIGGSVASTMHGAIRSTMDVDVVCDLRAVRSTSPTCGAWRSRWAWPICSSGCSAPGDLRNGAGARSRHANGRMVMAGVIPSLPRGAFGVRLERG